MSLDQIGHVDDELARLLVLVTGLDRAQLLEVALKMKQNEKTSQVPVDQFVCILSKRGGELTMRLSSTLMK